MRSPAATIFIDSTRAVVLALILPPRTDFRFCFSFKVLYFIQKHRSKERTEPYEPFRHDSPSSGTFSSRSGSVTVSAPGFVLRPERLLPSLRRAAQEILDAVEHNPRAVALSLTAFYLLSLPLEI